MLKHITMFSNLFFIASNQNPESGILSTAN
jgi:hypothetical protein